MNERMKKLLYGVLGLVVLVVGVIWFLTDGLEHIEDTNGADNYALVTITDQDIIDRKMGSMGLGKSTNNLNNTVKFSSNKFTGVEEIMWTDILFSTGVTMEILDFEVNAGNFKMAVVNESEIIKVIEPGESLVDLGAIEGSVSLVIAGESADFSFRIFESEYDSYSHHN